MSWLSNNWITVLGLIIIAVAGIYEGYEFNKKDKEQKIAAICEWLKYGVTVTEKALGSGTGQLKLRMLYSMATAQFPFITKLMTFEQFSDNVDDALEWMRKQLDENPNIKAAIIGDVQEVQ